MKRHEREKDLIIVDYALQRRIKSIATKMAA